MLEGQLDLALIEGRLRAGYGKGWEDSAVEHAFISAIADVSALFAEVQLGRYQYRILCGATGHDREPEAGNCTLCGADRNGNDEE